MARLNTSIEFRGKTLRDESWAYGDLTLYSKEMSYITEDLLEQDGTKQVYTKTLGQYIGLKDEDNNKIYEYDIILLSDNVYAIVEWSEGDAGFVYHLLTTEDGAETYDYPINHFFDSISKVKVVGNLFDNNAEDFNKFLNLNFGGTTL